MNRSGLPVRRGRRSPTRSAPPDQGATRGAGDRPAIGPRGTWRVGCLAAQVEYSTVALGKLHGHSKWSITEYTSISCLCNSNQVPDSTRSTAKPTAGMAASRLHPLAGEVIWRMFAWYVTGEYTDGEIAERLNADGLELPDGGASDSAAKGIRPGCRRRSSARIPSGSSCSTSSTAGWLPTSGWTRKARSGKRKNPLEVFPGEHPALVSAADFARRRSCGPCLQTGCV